MSKYSTLSINIKDPNNSTTKIFSKVKNKSLVLDVGCASGYFANLISKEKDCDVIGVEVDKKDAKKAEKYCRFVLTDDIEGEQWEKKLEDYKFDHIIFADVLEHLKDTGKVLKRVKHFLKPEGTILISIPNIAHVSLRIELLSGNFIPEKTGLLDNTHLKYFTDKSFSDIVKSSGYKIKSFSASVYDFPENKIIKFLENLGFTASKKGLDLLTSPDAIAYQYFYELSKNVGGLQVDRSKEKPIYVFKEYLTSLQKNYSSLMEEKEKINQTFEKTKAEIKALQNELNSIKASKYWKVAHFFKSMRDKLNK